MAGWAEAPYFAGERQIMFRMAVRAADPGKARARVPAVEIALDDFPDDRPEIPILLLEPALVLPQEPLKIMEKHPIEDCPP